MRVALLVAVLAPPALLACGGNVVGTAGASSGGTGGAITATGAGGGCVTPTVGMACTTAEAACQPADPCCTGYEWGCQGGSWQKLGLGCSCQAPPFPCGTTTCSTGFFCEKHPPGIAPPEGGVPPDSYTCAPVPASCGASPTCACIGASMSPNDPCSTSSGATCSEDASGNVTVVCLDV